MPVLKNARHEKFAQALAKGKTADDAYADAGFKPDRGMLPDYSIKTASYNALPSFWSGEQTVERKATEKAIDKLAITKERVLAELAKIGFSDIRKAIKWQGTLVTEEDNPNGGDVLVIKNVVTNNVQLVSSDEIDDDTAAAIAEISQNSTGGIKLKLHDKKGALVDIGKHLGMFVEKHEHSGPNGGPIQTETRTWREVLRQETKG